MKRFKLFSSYLEEEKWLNEQSKLGWKLVKKGICYTFRKNPQQELVYAVDYRIFKNKVDYQDYLNLFQDSGWIHVTGSKDSGEHYFSAAPKQGSSVSIFSDRKSSINRYKKKAMHHFQLVSVLLCYLLAFQILKIFDLKMLIEPSRAFLTSGLWKKSGEVFWQAFFFELPFAIIFHILPILFLIGYVILMVIYLLWAVYGIKQEGKTDDET